MELQGQLEQLRSQGLGLAAISYDAPEVLAKFAQERGITFPLLSDVGSHTITAFGILNTVADEALGPNWDDPVVAEDIKRHVTVLSPRGSKVIRGTPYPGTFVVDRDGRVTARFFEPFYRERVTASAVILRLGGGASPVAATRVTTDHLELTTYASDQMVAPGNRLTLVADITPRPGMHVYAPGRHDYRVVTLAIEGQPHVRVESTQYPPSEIYYFEPLDERVPVFQQPFRLLTDVVIEVSQETEKALRDQTTLTLSGTLEYQACDDRICYSPVSVPLTWPLTLRHSR